MFHARRVIYVINVYMQCKLYIELTLHVNQNVNINLLLYSYPTSGTKM